MQVLTWAHKRHRLIYSLASIDSNVAARAAMLEESWLGAPTLLDAPANSSEAAGDAPVQQAVPAPAALPTQLAGAAASVQAAQVASLAPRKPMKGEAELAAANAPRSQTSPAASTAQPPEEVVPEYLR